MTAALRAVAELLERESGIRLGEHQHGALSAALARVAPGVATDELLRRARTAIGGAGELARLLDEITVQESAFLREREPLERLRWTELLASAQASGSGVVRVWVAGCANGEEAYTLAMLACEAFGTSRPPVSILATDISRRALDRAREGSYRERALQELSAARRTRWLRRHADGRVMVSDELRHLVHFRRHNLVSEPVPPAGEAPFHVVACRNVLIYFDPARALAVAARLEDALAPGGVLLLGAADALTAAVTATPTPASPLPPAASTAPRETAAAARGGGWGRDELLARARAAAEAGRAADAREHVDRVLRRDPLDAGAHVLRGLVELAGGNPDGAVASLRCALFAEPGHGPAAFVLGCAHDAAGRPNEARAAYARARDTLRDGVDERHAAVFGELEVADAIAICSARLEGSSP